ncbi:MAG: hypothetical protein CSA32_01630 [Desulfobulbus propionicus]|nr:MAG: hypothetical protein CSA32_01630 [Desulfobulbus propionicus]
MTKTIAVTYQDNVAHLCLRNGVTNAISPDMVEEMTEAVCSIRENAGAMVLEGGAKFFSIGLDVPCLLQLNEKEMGVFWDRFNHLVLTLYSLSIPTVCSIAGHAVAGGNILAMACDYRLATDNKKKTGLNEVHLGLPVPHLASLMLTQIIGDRQATNMMYSGELMSLQDAMAIGFIDEIHADAALLAQASSKASSLATCNGIAFSIMKSNRTMKIQASYERYRETTNKDFLDCWFSAPVQQTLREAAKNF